MEKYIFELKMKVRDYECDLQGIVNNANYQHYIEHTRHEFLSSVGVSFAQLHQQGIKYVFVQDIYRLPDLKPVIKSTVETVCVVNGRLSDSALFNEIFAPYLNQ